MEVILREGLVDVAVVVTRYFGGILLGAGGLVRAYSHGAKLAIDAAQRIEMCVCSVLQMQMDYSAYGKILNLLPNYNTVILSTDFGAVVTMEVMVKACFASPLCADIVELTAALVTPQEKEKCFAQIPE